MSENNEIYVFCVVYFFNYGVWIDIYKGTGENSTPECVDSFFYASNLFPQRVFDISVMFYYFNLYPLNDHLEWHEIFTDERIHKYMNIDKIRKWTLEI